MKPVSRKRLWLVFVLAVMTWLVVRHLAASQTDHPARDAMRRAEIRAEAAFRVVDERKRTADLPFPAASAVPWATLLGEEFTLLTTTLGTRSAKEAATNPAWAALMVLWLFEAGVEPGDAVGITASGSFPGLIIAALAAVQEMGAEAVMAISVGSSAYGANSEQATWLDMASWIAEAGVMDTKAAAVTIGGESDVGEGMLPEGRDAIREAALRNKVSLFEPRDLGEAIERRIEILEERSPAVLINIGGGQAAVGRCLHEPLLPTGPWGRFEGCGCPDRGVMTRLRERGVPVVHLLRVRELAARSGLDPEPGRRYRDPGGPYRTVRVSKIWAVAALMLVSAPLVLWRRAGVRTLARRVS